MVIQELCIFLPYLSSSIFQKEMFDKCHWKDKGNTFKEVMNYSKSIFLLNPIEVH